MIRRKFVWLMILMVWVGMVTSIVVYQGDDYLTLEPVTTDDVEIVDQEKKIEEIKKKAEQDISSEDESTDENYFMDHRVERNKVRSEQIDSYREMINNPNHTEEARKKAEEKLLELTERMEKEMEIESLIRGRGYEDSLAFIHDNSVDVIIQSDKLKQDEVSQIGDVIVKTTDFSPEDLTIIEKKKSK
ncbi:MAG: SpoIIIAH-like family protein [Bacillota bacterium]